ncbi:MAG TPA: sugar ABC transporter substrate-binding protein [Pseudonocardia sp.]|nr:sugar ABC transporter substrate-binding protein [Pseudonocardia sp.]
MALSRRTFLTALGAAAATGGLAACGSSGSSGAGGADRLRFALWANTDAELGAFTAITDAFRQQTGVTVEIENLAYAQMRPAIDSRLQSGDAPDLFRVSYTDIGAYTSTGALADLSAQLGDGFGDAFTPALWSAVLAEGAPVGVPHHTDCSAFVYNVDAFTRAGITEVPATLDEAWTWEEFIELMERVKAANPDSSAFGVNWQLGGAYRWLSFLGQAGGAVYDESMQQVTIDSPAGRRALEFTKSFYDRGLHPANLLVKSQTYVSDVFPSGQLSAIYAGDFLLPSLVESVKDFEFGATFLPRDVAHATELGGNAVVVTADSPNVDAAAEFCKFLAGAENMKAFCEQTTVLPVRNDLVDAQLDYAVRPDLMPVFQTQATTIPEHHVRTCTSPQFSGIADALLNELENCFAAGQSVDDTLGHLEAEITKLAGR